ncbi:MAG: hypothetical protein E6R03_03740 [Hyphomicrobiaceae bacterium]|nr:MAG: hypothetical protein E6R03_03740 [Hyphomicrobiaceae bacterium]
MRTPSFYVVLCQGFAAFALLVSPASTVSNGAAPLPFEHHVENMEPGMCWFCCVETIGYAQGRKDTQQLRNKALITGIGAGGASEQHKAYWQKRAGFTISEVSRHYWMIHRRLQARQHIIATVSPWSSEDKRAHALVLVNCTAQRQEDHTNAGRFANDYWVTYFDPNHPGSLNRMPWAEFAKIFIRAEVLLEE